MIYIKKKSAKKMSGRNFFYIVFFVIIIYVFGYFLSFFTQKKINTTLVEYAQSDNSQIINGIIIKDEKIYTATKAGLVTPNLHDNEVAKKNSTVCTIQDKTSIDKLENELSQINNDIFAMQKKRSEISLFRDDIKNANMQIEKIIDENIYLCSQNDIDKINNFLASLQNNIDLRNQILLTENHGNVKEMSEKKSDIEQKIKKNISNIIANQSGIVSYFTDGLENNFSVKKINDLTFEQLNIKSQSRKFNNIVNKNDAIFKIIESNDWYIVARVKNKDIEDIEENSSKIIYVEQKNTYVPIEFTVQKILRKNKNESLLILKTDRFVQNFLDIRNIKFKLKDASRRGFKTPISAIVKKNLFKIPPEFVNKNHTVTKQNVEAPIKIYDSDENYFYAESQDLKSGDIINVGEKTFKLNQFKKIRGVYIANTGITEFKKINYPDDLPATGFIIIEPKLNPTIKIYDRIITNTENVSNNQKIIEH